jgi:predicted kinase
VHAQTCRQAGSSFAAGRQSDGGELLAVSSRHLCPGPNQVWKALRKDFALTEPIAAEEFAHVESKLDTTTTTGGISHRSAIPAMNGGRWVTAQGTAGRGMRRDDRDTDFVFASLDLVNLHPFGKREQRIAFHYDLVSLSTQSDEFFWRAVYHPFSLSHQPHQFTDSPKSAMSRISVLDAIIIFMEENYKPLAHIIIGFIGSGKTTFARKLEKETGAIRFTKDEWMVRLFGNTPPKDKFEEYDNKMASLATDMALKCLKAGISVIIDEGFWVKEQRDEIREKVKNVGAIPKLYYLEVSFEIMKARTLKRSENPPVDSFNIDEESFNQYWKYFQPPDKDEEYTLINQVNSG